MNPFEINTLVRFDYETFIRNWDVECYERDYEHNFPINGKFIFMGEIKQMPGHCILCNIKTGKIIAGYHTDNFIELTEEEV